MELTQYPHSEYDFFKLMNKLKFPTIPLTWLDYEEFNEVYEYCVSNMIEGRKTKSGGIAGGPYNRYHSFYIVNESKMSIELVVCDTSLGCYRFIVGNEKSSDSLTGSKAQRELIKVARELDLTDEIASEAVSSEEGEQIKSTIESPIIQVVSDMYRGREFEHCYHLDANSSYFSRICEWKPSLRPLGEYLYAHRKANNGLYKQVMTNTIGAWQSKYCIDINDEENRHRKPYQLARFAREAINGTNQFITDQYYNLLKSGYKPLLINTDGIWYQDTKQLGAYHDANEGTSLCQWKNDHNDVKLYIKSAGAYQYIEDGACKTVLRGTCQLDRIKPNRDDWTWREFETYQVIQYKFDKQRGIITYEN